MQLLETISKQETEDLNIMTIFNNQLKEIYSSNMYLTGLNMQNMDSSFWESFLEYRKKAINMHPHRIFKFGIPKDSNKDLENI